MSSPSRRRRMVPCQILILAVTARFNVLFSASQRVFIPLLFKSLLIYSKNVRVHEEISFFQNTITPL